MKYISSRGKAPELGFKDVVIAGLASDGGLYVPKNIPHFRSAEIESWRELSYTDLAYQVMSKFTGGTIPENDLRDIIKRSYAGFRHEQITPLNSLKNGDNILELFHGPTLAFKDVALQFLGNLLDYILDERKQDVTIVGATSGDTGSAAIEGCRGCKHIEMFMLHPSGRVSDVQRKQMTTILDENIHNIAIKGDFDDCQNMVKQMFADQNFNEGKPLVAVNSINWARIMAQIVYYFYAYFRISDESKEDKEDKEGQKISGEVNFIVPTGNFGDIFAGYIAKNMGLPVAKLVVATNKNDILDRFFKENNYSKATVTPTFAPSMDIQISSNFERLLFDLYDNDGQQINYLLQGFNDSGSLSVSQDIWRKSKELFDSNSCDDDAIVNIIKKTYSESGYIVDPHTATALDAMEKLQLDKKKTIILATAHPAKFPDIIEKTLNIAPALPDHLSDLMQKKEKFSILDNDIELIKEYITSTNNNSISKQ